MNNNEHWYISYYCVNHTFHYGVTAETIPPAEWSIRANQELADGPYVVLYGERITREQYDYVKGIGGTWHEQQ